MSERLSSPESLPGKFSSPRDEVLNTLAAEGWANRSDGQVESIAGWFASISNSPADMHSILDAFDEAMNTAGLADPNELLGHFLLQEDEHGNFTVTKFDDVETLDANYETLERWHAGWLEHGVYPINVDASGALPDRSAGASGSHSEIWRSHNLDDL